MSFFKGDSLTLLCWDASNAPQAGMCRDTKPGELRGEGEMLKSFPCMRGKVEARLL